MEKCKCGDPLMINGLCDHCDTPCKAKQGTCPRCRSLGEWEPWPGYRDGVKKT